MGHLLKKKERIKKLKETGDTSYIYKNELDKTCFQQDMTYGDFKDLTKRTVSDKVLRDKAFNVAKHARYDGYQRGLASMIYKCFAKKSKGRVNIPLKFNKQLAEELYKPIFRNLKKRTVYSGFKDNVWSADLVDMQLISKFNKGFRFLFVRY